MNATLSAENAKGIITALLNNPNVDYIEANQRFPIKFSSRNLNSFSNLLSTDFSEFDFANPQGSNPSDLKHTYHDVLDAWDYTRGSGAKVGILDSGFSFYQNTNNPHPDGLLLNATKGIKTLGFVDDYDSYGNCNGGSGQASGNCIPYDDDGHGTYMAGLVGANDNNQGHVGVMPDGLTISMKIAQDCTVTYGCQDDSVEYQIESDDLNAAIIWARNNDLDVLSMSFELPYSRLNQFGTPTLYNNFYDAYYSDDILIISSTGNPGDTIEYPEAYGFVMGIGGLDSNGGNYGIDTNEEVSGLSGGGTLQIVCGGLDFCRPEPGYGGTFFSIPSGGKTSASTAIVAGIAGLVRSYHPSMSASELRQRLINTSEGPHNKVSALRAILNDIPMTVTIDGPVTINSSGNYSWEAMPEDGGSNLSYHWEYQVNGSTSWQTVGSSKIYSRYVSTGDQNFFLRVTVTSNTEQASDVIFITVNSDDCPPLQICPEG